MIKYILILYKGRKEMNNIMSKANVARMSLPVCLQTIWYVEADVNYYVNMNMQSYTHFVAIRTIKGNGIISTSDNPDRVLSSETLYITKASNIVKYYCPKDEWIFWWFEFGAEVSGLIELNKIYHLDIEETEVFKFKNMFTKLNSDEINSEIYSSCEFSSVIAQWAMLLKQENMDIQKVFEYITQNLTKGIKIKELADILNMSERGFRKYFKDFTGKSPKKYIEEKILISAQELIHNTDLSVKEIAFSLGYNDPYYFSRAYKKFYGMSPKMSGKHTI